MWWVVLLKLCFEIHILWNGRIVAIRPLILWVYAVGFRILFETAEIFLWVSQRMARIRRSCWPGRACQVGLLELFAEFIDLVLGVLAPPGLITQGQADHKPRAVAINI